MVDIKDYKREEDCSYKKESYSVRDNGAVFRHSREGKRSRKYDDTWTFGKLNIKTGYLEIASLRIHRIVATAFHGEPLPNKNLVDHKDTNKQNNRPENLRWVTRLENILLNSITVKRIETSCDCSIEEFLANPSKYRHKFKEPNYSWMGTVTEEQAKNSLKNLLEWAKSDRKSKGGSLGEWIYNRGRKYQYEQQKKAIESPTNSLTTNAVQANWKIPSEFPCCPTEPSSGAIQIYFANLKPGKVFSQNQMVTSIVSNYAISDDKSTIWVVCESKGLKPWYLAKVAVENSLFVHTNLGSYFKKDGAEKYFTLEQGLDWTGGDVFDDFC